MCKSIFIVLEVVKIIANIRININRVMQVLKIFFNFVSQTKNIKNL